MKISDLIAIGLGLVSIGLPYWLKNMPETVSVGLVIFGMALIVAGLLDFFRSKKTDSTPHGVMLSDPILAMEGDISTVRIEIKNIGADFLEKCLVVLDKIEPLPQELRSVEFPIGIPTERQVAQGRKGRFNLDSYMHKYLTVVRYARGNPRNPLSIPTEEHEKKLFPLDQYKLVLRASCEKGVPNFKEFVIGLDAKRERLVISKP